MELSLSEGLSLLLPEGTLERGGSCVPHMCPQGTEGPGTPPGPLCRGLAIGPMNHLGPEAGNTSLPPRGILEWFLSAS